MITQDLLNSELMSECRKQRKQKGEVLTQHRHERYVLQQKYDKGLGYQCQGVVRSRLRLPGRVINYFSEAKIGII